MKVPQKFDPSIMRRMTAVAECQADSFEALVRASQLDPQRHFRRADWHLLDFTGCDLRDFDFSHARLTACRFNGARIAAGDGKSAAKFERAEFDNGIVGVDLKREDHPLRAAVDWAQFASDYRSPRHLPMMNIVTLGHLDHGKATLGAALTRVTADKGWTRRAVSYDELLRASESQGRRDDTKILNIGGAIAEFCSLRYRYSNGIAPGHADYMKSALRLAAGADGAILVVSTVDGPMPMTREHIIVARQMDIPKIVVFLNKCDIVDDVELLDLVEMEIRELLRIQNFPGDDVPCIRGAAVQALNGELGPLADEALLKLIGAMDEYFSPRPRKISDPARLWIGDVYIKPGVGCIVTGVIDAGTIGCGDRMELLGYGKSAFVVVESIRIWDDAVEAAQAGQFAGIRIRVLDEPICPQQAAPEPAAQKPGPPPIMLPPLAMPAPDFAAPIAPASTQAFDLDLCKPRRGMMLAQQGSVPLVMRVKAELYVLTKDEGGRHTPFFKHYKPQVFYGTMRATGTIIWLDREMAMPGDNVSVEMSFEYGVPLVVGERFTLREGGRTIGSGIVKEAT
ncbi:MAG TPA: GTP-binding protein [Hyphomicrobiaceae bacterium]|nr:GTP-binding protein [Hyphomicrobiaceae bacterium]